MQCESDFLLKVTLLLSLTEKHYLVSAFFIFFAPENRLSMNANEIILTITGSDGSGGSGVQADIRMISQLGGVTASAITSITVQNTLGIQQFYDLPTMSIISTRPVLLCRSSVGQRTWARHFAALPKGPR